MIRPGDVVVEVGDDKTICHNDHSSFTHHPSSVGRLYRVTGAYRDAKSGCYMLSFREDPWSDWCHGTFRKLEAGTIPQLSRQRAPEPVE